MVIAGAAGQSVIRANLDAVMDEQKLGLSGVVDREKAVQAVMIISGEAAVFTDNDGDRSILSLKDTKPGSIALHSRLIDAEIYLDGSFIGYTTGDSRIPFIIEELSPGIHTLETRLGADFGIVKLPELLVQSGRRSVIRAEETHYNQIIYRLMYLLVSPKS
jgi:hypothetical protein